MEQETEYKCAVCRKTDTFVTEKGTVVRFFLAPQTNEVLCSKCNAINNSIAKSKNDLREGKERIIKINRQKYYLIPIRARTGKWTDNPHVVADEIFDGKSYFIGGWAAANYWKLTDQIPMQFDIWTTKRQGRQLTPHSTRCWPTCCAWLD